MQRVLALMASLNVPAPEGTFSPGSWGDTDAQFVVALEISGVLNPLPELGSDQSNEGDADEA